MARLLLVDDEAGVREMTRIMLERDGWTVELAESGERAVKLLAECEESFDVVLTDLRMKGLTGLEVLEAAKQIDASTQTVMMTAYASAETAVAAMKLGAYDYIEKPFKRDVLTTLLSKALEKRQILQENVQLKRQIEGARLGKMIGQSKPMQQLYDLLRRVAPTRTNVLIVGETGTGKELVARALHELSTRAKQAFVTVNCGAIPENLIESELFGHVKGSFTGAIRDKVGLFAAADGGTLFLDEIGELPLLTQVRLLRVLQERRLQPVGSTQELEVDVRVVAATNRDLVEEVRERRMREDLYYRLNVIQINMPPLRDRPEDIPLLTQHFVNKFAKEQNKEIEGLSPEAMQLLMGYRFPGNVRELENIVERAVTLSSSPKISTELLPSPMLQKEQLTRVSAELGLPEEGIDLEQMVEGLERSLLDKALARTKGNRTEAAKLLNISFRSLRYRLNKYGMGED